MYVGLIAKQMVLDEVIVTFCRLRWGMSYQTSVENKQFGIFYHFTCKWQQSSLHVHCRSKKQSHYNFAHDFTNFHKFFDS